MGVKRVQMKRWNGSGWDNIYPVTNVPGQAVKVFVKGEEMFINTAPRGGEMPDVGAFNKEMEDERIAFFSQEDYQ